MHRSRIEYLSLVIYKWLAQNDRLLDKKYWQGELWRVSRASDDALSAINAGHCYERPVLVSPYLNRRKAMGTVAIPWMIDLHR